MINNETLSSEWKAPQCQFFVVRKKRLCRMTVRPGGNYCGEHEPQPQAADGHSDKRIPCPHDPKHTVYVSKLEKHLSICNARPGAPPPYIINNVNSPPAVDECPRQPLIEVPTTKLLTVIDKINKLYDEHVKICELSEKAIHPAVSEEFKESGRTESSLRHLRQASRLLWLAQDEGLVNDHTCYVELGAGKGQLSYYAATWWCSSSSCVLAVDRASLRHKRDNRAQATCRLRADLAHLHLDKVESVQHCNTLVGLAKHLCGVATDYAIRCVTSSARCKGLLMATCCHHRCERAAYLANTHLQKLGVSGEELNVMFSIVSWATCGDGRSRERRKLEANSEDEQTDIPNDTHNATVDSDRRLSHEYREVIGRKAKALIDWGRVLYLRERGFDARLCFYVPTAVSLENICIIAKKHL